MPLIKVQRGDVEYAPAVDLVEPRIVVTTGASWGENAVGFYYDGNRKCWASGEVGAAALVTTNYIWPLTVSFRGIAVSEHPCDDEYIVTGCFTNGHSRTHTIAAGAGEAHLIGSENFWFVDGARTGREEAGWSPNSVLDWKIPIGWHRKLTTYAGDFNIMYPDHERLGHTESRALIMDRIYHQRFSIDDDGVYKIEKYGHWITRSRFCFIVLDGETIQRSHPTW